MTSRCLRTRLALPSLTNARAIWSRSAYRRREAVETQGLKAVSLTRRRSPRSTAPPRPREVGTGSRARLSWWTVNIVVRLAETAATAHDSHARSRAGRSMVGVRGDDRVKSCGYTEAIQKDAKHFSYAHARKCHMCVRGMWQGFPSTTLMKSEKLCCRSMGSLCPGIAAGIAQHVEHAALPTT